MAIMEDGRHDDPVTRTPEQRKQEISSLLMRCADWLAANPDVQPDLRVWSHLLVYAPKPETPVKRYSMHVAFNVNGVVPHHSENPHGQWVRYEDYMKLLHSK